ncbi:MAG: cell division protein SepF [Candidatus Aenigmarchaeota archaeon]|nr:cell division protein SepF [Candidatus Aenigmarchaeota archaeon]
MLRGSEDQDYTELVMDNEQLTQNLPIVVEKIESFACADRVIRHVREGKVTFARVGEFKNVNVDEFKRTLSKIKTVCTAVNGDIVGVAGDWLIIAPSMAKIERN